MANFDIAVQKILNDEGGFVDNKYDKGGVTNYGISLNFLKTIRPDAAYSDIKLLRKESATQIYKKYFWDAYNIGMIVDDRLAECIFELFVNMSPKSATTVIQKAINEMSGNSDIFVDGVLGPKTMASINMQTNIGAFIGLLKLNQIRHYVEQANKETSNRIFLYGWIKRALDG